MADTKFQLPPDIIRTIERVISVGDEARVKLDHGTIKVQLVTVKLVDSYET